MNEQAIEAAASVIHKHPGSPLSFGEAGADVARTLASAALTAALPHLTAPAGVEREQLRSIMSECSDDFHVCSQCGYQDDDATRTSNLYLLLNELVSAPPAAPVVVDDNQVFTDGKS